MAGELVADGMALAPSAGAVALLARADCGSDMLAVRADRERCEWPGWVARGALAVIVRADAFSLPFRDGSFDVVVADPPYDVSNPNSKHLMPRSSKQDGPGRKRLAETGYIEFTGRDWVVEARRCLRPDGHLYIFAVIKELDSWLTASGQPNDIIAWVQPNAQSVQSRIRRVIGGRSLAWRPILHYQKGRAISWTRENGSGTEYIGPNYVVESQVQANMVEAVAWPNQLPLRLVIWLLRPHRGRVLDLFSGTGTTREAAVGLGLDVVSVDLSPQALALVCRRPLQPPLGIPRS